MPLKVIDGKLVLRCTLRAKGQEMPANLLVDLANSGALTLHGNTAKMLELSKQTRVDVLWKGGSLESILPRQNDNAELEAFSKDFAPELEEVPAVGILGFAAFENQIVQVDVGGGRIRFARPEEDGKTLFPQASPNIVISDYLAPRSAPQIAGESRQKKKLNIQIASVRYESVLNSEWIGSPASESALMGLVKLNDVDIAALGPVRIYEFDTLGGSAPDVILGTSALNALTMTFDTVAKKVAIESRALPEQASVDQPYFIALYNHNADEVEAYLKRAKDIRYGREASNTLLSWRLSGKTIDLDSSKRAVTYYAASQSAGQRSAQLIALADQLVASDDAARLTLAEYALGIAHQNMQADLNSAAVHQINARYGYLALKQKNYPQARKLLLAAAFGLPRDPQINLWLGQTYKEMGQLTRAWSRYLEVALIEQPPVEAFMGLEEVYRQPEFRKQYRLSDIQMMMEGRVPAFAPIQERPQETKPSIRLVELFADIDRPASLGAELAVHALPAYLGESDVVTIQYPLGHVLVSSAAEKRAGYYDLAGSSAAVVMDGTVVTKEGGDESAAPALFDDYLRYSGQQTLAENRLRIQADATLENREIRLDLKLRAEPSENLGDIRLHALLCEKMVFAYSRNGAFLHQHIVRESLTPSSGYPLHADTSSADLTLAATISSVEKQLEDTWQAAANKKIKWRMKPTFIDPTECEVIVFAQKSSNHKVISVIRVPIVMKGTP